MATGNEIEARELQLYADNTFALYGQKQSIESNLERKVLKGKYDSEKAVKLWEYWAESAAKSYHKDFGSPGFPWHRMFDKPTRRLMAQSSSKDWEAENLGRLKKEAKTQAKKASKKKTAKKTAKRTSKKPGANGKKKTAKKSPVSDQIRLEREKIAKLRSKSRS